MIVFTLSIYHKLAMLEADRLCKRMVRLVNYCDVLGVTHTYQRRPKHTKNTSLRPSLPCSVQ